MNRPAVSQAKMRRAARAVERAGYGFGGFRLHPDGSVDVLTADRAAPKPSDQLDDELARWASEHGYD